MVLTLTLALKSIHSSERMPLRAFDINQALTVSCFPPERRDEMRRFFCCLIIAGFTFYGCSRQSQPETESKMFQNFSLDKIVERVHAPELKAAWSTGGYTSWPPNRRQRTFSDTFKIEERDDAKFDEDGFMRQLKDEAQRLADESGVHTVGGGATNDRFELGYLDAGQEGWLEVIGTRAEGHQYKLWAVIRENTK
jgi:hypothetical protein